MLERRGGGGRKRIFALLKNHKPRPEAPCHGQWRSASESSILCDAVRRTELTEPDCATHVLSARAKCSAGFRAPASFWARGPLETQGGKFDAKVPCVGRWHTVAEARNPGPGSAPLDLAEVASVSELSQPEGAVIGGKQRALFGWLEANFQGTRVLGTHGPHDPAAPEGKPARHARVEPDGRDARRICAGPWDTGLLRLHPGLLNEGGAAHASWMGRTRDARKEDAILGQAGWPAEPASRAGGATGYSGHIHRRSQSSGPVSEPRTQARMPLSARIFSN